jgi:deazaflavin-dependent oxidoreductase (nitroreductase family)
VASQLKIVTPPTTPGLARRVYAAFATARIAKVLSRLVNWKLDPVLLRLTGGRIATTLMFRAAVLETRGARTGRVRRHAVIYFHVGDRVILTASNAGAARNPSWYHNLRTNPDVTFAGRRMRAGIVEDHDDQRRLQELGDRTFPAFATYRSQAADAGRAVPIIELTPIE